MVFAAVGVPRSTAGKSSSFSHPFAGLHAGHALSESQTPKNNNKQSLTLKVGELIQREIKGGETQVLTVALLREQYAQVVFEWRGMDLDVQVLKPGETQPVGPGTQVRGSRSLPVSFIADADGDYKLVVRPVEDAKVSGSYRVVLETVRSPSLADRKREEAEKLLAEAQKDKSKETATQKLRQALELWTDVGEPYGAVYTLKLMGSLFIASQQPSTTTHSNSTQLPDGEEYYRRAIEIARSGDPRRFAYTLVDIGSDYEKFISPKRARVYYEQALKIFREIGDQRGEATALYSIGFAEATIGHMQEGLKWYEQALVIQHAESDRLSEARTLNAMGGAYNVLADQDRALSFYRQAEPVWKELGDRYREAITIKNIGVIYDDWGDWQTAKDTYLKALSLLEPLLTTKDLNSCKSAMLSQDARVCNSIANTLDNIGELYNSLGDPESALNTFRECLTIRKTLNQPKGIGATLSRIAYAYLLENNPSEALNHCDLAMPYSRKADDLRKQGSIFTFMGMAHAALHEPEKALEYYQEALRLQRETGERRGEGITLDQMGRAYVLKKDVAKALQSYDQALKLWREIKDEDWETRALYNIANVERERGDFARAHEQIEKALQIVESRRGSLTNLQLRTSYFANKEDLYELDIDLKMQISKGQNSGTFLASALETSERARARTFIDTLNEVGFDRSTSAEFLKSDPKLVELVDRKRLLQGKLNGKRQSQTSLLTGKHPPEQATAIAREIDALTNEYEEVETQIRTRNVRYAALTKPQPLNLAKFQQQLDDNTLLLEIALGEKRSYVWVVSQTSIDGFELPARDQIEPVARRVTEAITARNREEKNESFPQRQLRIAKAEKDYSEASATLSKMVLDPVASLLGQKRLVVVADGALQMVPFAALPVPANSAVPASLSNAVAIEKTKQTANVSNDNAPTGPAPLITEHEIVTLPSASVLALQRGELANRKPAPLAVAVLADPVFDQQDARVAKVNGNASQHRKDLAKSGQAGEVLPKQEAQSSPATSGSTNKQSQLATALRDVGLDPDGTMPRLALSRQEALAISRAVPTNQSFSALDFKASRATATSAELSKYRIIHFATHGVLDLDHPELSGIVLSMVDEKGKPQDGYLRLHEIYNLNLPAELVVLSACQTGIGKQVKGEGLIALTRGFMYAGAKSVVASLWKVDDAATAELMAEFYKQMFTNKLKPAAALRAAQVKMSQKKRWRSPYYWAGFFLQGEWN